MTPKFQIIICVFVTMGVILGIPTIQVDATSYPSVEQIYRNVNQYDEQDVTLTGKVVGLTFSVSDSGNKYTTFMLDDDTATPITVFSYSHLLISEGDTVKVSGTFHEAFEKGNYTFYMQIMATPGEVIVVKRAEDFLSKLLPVIIAIFVIVAIIIVYKKRYKQDKIPKDSKYEVGIAFETYVQSLFDGKDWRMVNYTKDAFKKFGRKVESDSDPDFVMRHKDTNEVIAIECKYRSKFMKGLNAYGITWAEKHQIENYNAFWEKTKYPVFAIIGIGGAPSKPKRIFTVPLYQLKYPFASGDYLQQFERHPKDKFTIEEFKKLDENKRRIFW